MKKLITLTIILYTVQFLTPIFGQTEQKPRLVVQTGHSRSVITVAFSPDGKFLASSGMDNNIKLWDVASGQELRVFTGHTEPVYFLTFDENGNTIISGGLDQTLRFWDTATGKEKQPPILSDAIGKYSINYSPKSKIAVFINQRNGLEILNVESRMPPIKILGEGIQKTAFSPNGKLLATVCHDVIGDYDAVKIWDLANTKEPLLTLERTSFISSLEFSPSGNMIASINRDKIVSIWNLEKKSQKMFNDHLKDVFSVNFSPDGKFLISGSLDKTVGLWDVETGNLLYTLVGHTSAVYTTAFSPTEKLVATAGQDSEVILWNYETEQRVRTLESKVKTLTTMAYSIDGNILASAGLDKSINVWDMKTGNLSQVLKGHSDFIQSIFISPTNKEIVSLGNDKLLNLWDLTNGKYKSLVTDLKGNPKTAAISSDGKYAAVGQQYGFTTFVNLENGENWQLNKSSSDTVDAIVYSSDGKMLAQNDTGNLEVWNISEDFNSLKFKLYDGFGLTLMGAIRVTTLAFSPDNRYLISGGSRSQGILVWDMLTGEELKNLKGHTDEIRSLIFTKDGKTLVSASLDGSIRFWDTATWEEKNKPILTSEWFCCVAFNPSEKLLFVGSSLDSSVRIYDYPAKKELAKLISLGKDEWIITTPDGRFDTNKLEKTEGLSWIMPDAPFRPLSLDIFMRDYYEPNLLPRLLKCIEKGNCDKDLDSYPREFRAVRDLSSLNRTQPKINITKIVPVNFTDTVEVSVEVENMTSEYQKNLQGEFLTSGVYDVRLFRDGQLVEHSTPDEKVKTTFRAYKNFDEELAVWRIANNVELDNGKETLTFKVKLPNNRNNQPLEFSAYAFNDDRVKSETARLTYKPEKPNQNIKPRKAYIVAFGVNNSQNPELRLQFAAKDARVTQETLSKKLRKRAEFDEVIEIPLISDNTTQSATKENLQTVFDLLSGKNPSAERLKSLGTIAGKIQLAQPDDAVFIFFSSHGKGDSNGVFYILPSNIGRNSGQSANNDLLKNSISSDELSLWLRDVDASEMVMIIDACFAESAVKNNSFKPAPMGSRGLGQLAFDKGMKILAATQSSNVANEFKEITENGKTIKIEQGLLTYALIQEGLMKNAADFKAEDKIINLREWLEFAEFRVPRLYEKSKSGKEKGVANPNPKTEKSIQQPYLFDFTRRKKDFVLSLIP